MILQLLTCFALTQPAYQTQPELQSPVHEHRELNGNFEAVYLQMGGTSENITVVPIGAELASIEKVKASFRSFKGEEAECFLPEDRHKLLAVIEASFGDFTKFDALVRSVFVQTPNATEQLHLEVEMAVLG